MIKVLWDRYRKWKNPTRHARSIGVTVGEHGKIASSVEWGSEPWLIKLGAHVQLTTNIQFITHDGATWVFTNQDKYKDVIKYGAIEIKDNCFIGLRTIIMPGVTIGPNSVVGAGSIVTKDVPPNSVYAGNPAHFICSTTDYAEKCYLLSPEYDKAAYFDNKEKEVKRAYNIE